MCLILTFSFHLRFPPRRAEYAGVHISGDLLMTLLIDCHRVLWTTIRFGEELRAYVDVGFSTITDA